jgi:hypothetical protein
MEWLLKTEKTSIKNNKLRNYFNGFLLLHVKKMSRYDSNFREPPWVMGSPHEVMNWMDASHPSEKDKGDHKKKQDFLNNLHIRFDFDVKTTEIKSTNFLHRLFGIKMIMEDFKLLPTAELILRGLAKAKFRNTAKIMVDGKILYEHPEKKSDLRRTIEDISEFSDQINNGNNLEITAILSDVEKSTARIRIKKTHSKKEHSIDIFIKGKIRVDIYHTFLNYLKEKIGLKDE